MLRASTILRELVQSLAKVTLLLKHSVKLRRCILCGDVAACREMACVLFVVQTDKKKYYIYLILEWTAFFLHTWKVPISNSGLETGYPT